MMTEKKSMFVDKVTIGIVNYNGRGPLPETIRSIKGLNYPNFDVIVADNCSTDGSREWLQENHPDVYCLCLESNRGLPGAREALLRAAHTDYILFLDNDITLSPDTLTTLMQVMKSVPRAAACHPEICDPNDRYVYHYNGGWIHFLGAYISRNNDIGNRPDYELFDIVSGGALLVDRNVALDIGGFDADYFFNWEDGDFVSRLVLAGYSCMNVPQATVQHIGKPRGTSKAYYMVRNRWYFMLKLYQWKTLLLITPALLVFEVLQALFLIMKGHWSAYWQANFDVIRTLPETLEKRQSFQKMKVKHDRHWLRSGDIYLSESALQSNLLLTLTNQVINKVFAAYWWVVRPLC